MNLDFHYYGTFVAARLAGYNHNESWTIAYAAQYVDDSNKKRIQDNGSYYIKDFDQVPTVQDFSDIIKNELSRLIEAVNTSLPSPGSWSESFYNEVFKVWPVFHFLPGNFKRSDIRQYNGEKTFKGSFSIWKFDEEAREQFKLLCLPNGVLIRDMVNDLRNSKEKSLEFIGLRMHVLADTWAHKYFSGIPAWFINNASGFSVNLNNNDPKSFFQILVKIISSSRVLTEFLKGIGIDIKDPNAFMSSISTVVPFFNSYFFLGHCLANHLPDDPSKVYTFKPKWSSAKIEKNNPTDYFFALTQMVQALKAIKNNKEFYVDSYADIGASNKKVIMDILNTKQYDQTAVWKANIPKLKDASGNNLTPPLDYDPDSWLTEYKNHTNSNVSYYKFNKAAVSHLNFVLKDLNDNNVSLSDDYPPDRILTFKVEDMDKESYISKNVLSGGKNYPSLGSSGVNLEFILPNKSGKLLSGSVVKIRTTEKLDDEKDIYGKRYLGAWTTSKSLYYYTKDWDIFKQKWKIIQEESSDGKPIDLSKPVLIKNEHFDKPYLTPYSSLGKSWLTTTQNRHHWYLKP